MDKGEKGGQDEDGSECWMLVMEAGRPQSQPHSRADTFANTQSDMTLRRSGRESKLFFDSRRLALTKQGRRHVGCIGKHPIKEGWKGGGHSKYPQ